MCHSSSYDRCGAQSDRDLPRPERNRGGPQKSRVYRGNSSFFAEFGAKQNIPPRM